MQWFYFQLGWLNLWILALIIFATPVLLNLVRGKKGQGGLARATVLPPMSQKERAVYMLVMAPQFLLPIYAIFVPFTQNTVLLSVGLGLFAVGQIFRLKSIWDYTTVPTDELITQGVYQISRNPGYFGAAVLYLGMAIAGGSWFVMAVAVYWFIGYQWVASIEERFCEQRWPDVFSAYKRQVAKNFLFF